MLTCSKPLSLRRRPMTETALKNGWKPRRFDEMAIIVNDRIDDPSKADLERYVGLEHLDSNSLKIRRWGSPSDVRATKLLFRSGDIIFGRRRVYQRKLAVADFDGICSAHAMVLRAKPEIALPEFLPFFMQSDLFMERAEEISVGSLSPTINWKTLAKQEFALPSLKEQRRIAEVLQASQTVGERLFQLHKRAIILLESLNEYVFSQFDCCDQIRDACDINATSLNNSQLSSSETWEYADLSSVEFPTGIGDLAEIRLSEAPSRARRIALNGDILVSTVRPNLRGHAIIRNRQKPLVASTGFAVLRPRKVEFGPIVYGMVLSTRFLRHCESRVAGTSYPAVRPRDVGDFPNPRLSLLSQAGLADAFLATVTSVEQSHARWRRFTDQFTKNLREVLLTS